MGSFFPVYMTQMHSQSWDLLDYMMSKNCSISKNGVKTKSNLTIGIFPAILSFISSPKYSELILPPHSHSDILGHNIVAWHKLPWVVYDTTRVSIINSPKAKMNSSSQVFYFLLWFFQHFKWNIHMHSSEKSL